MVFVTAYAVAAATSAPTTTASSAILRTVFLPPVAVTSRNCESRFRLLTLNANGPGWGTGAVRVNAGSLGRDQHLALLVPVTGLMLSPLALSLNWVIALTGRLPLHEVSCR